MTAVVLHQVRPLVGNDVIDLAIVDGVVAPAASAGADAEHLDCDGRYVMPGLWDQHVHMTQWAINQHRLDMSGCTSAAEAARYAAQHATLDEPLIGALCNSANWPDERTGALLDEAVGDAAVVLVNFDLHSAWVSSGAMRRYGFDGPGTVLVEEECFELQRRISDLPVETTDAWVAEEARAAATRGVVGIRDLEMTWNLTPWQRRMAAGFDALRVEASIYPRWLDQALEMGIRTGDVDPDFPLLTVGPFKLIADGSLNAMTAYCHDAFPNGGTGMMNFTEADLQDSMRRAHEGGLACAIHAIGDRANTIVLDAFVATRARGTVEHAQLLSDADICRFRELGVVASVQPQHCLDDRAAGERIWAGRTQRMYRFGDLYQAGAELILGSDAPVAPLEPWFEIQAAVDRRLPSESEAWHPEQCIPRDAALAASTHGHGLALSVGDVADLVLVDADPLTCDSATLRAMPVAATMLGGRFTHRTI